MAGLVVRPSNVTWLAWPRSWLPNKRLKLTGGDRFKGNGVLCAGAHELSFNDGALRASRPQLKRDPLGSATDSLNDEAPIRSSRPHHLHDRAGFRVRAGYATSRSVGLHRRHWGSWERTKERGHYRIIVWSGGWAHVASK